MLYSTPPFYKKPILILGCGNILFGDDGFGPAVVEYLKKNYEIPEDVGVIDVGSGVRKILFNIVLSEDKPKKIIIVDAIDAGKIPGEVFKIAVRDMPQNKLYDFSMHQLPTSNLLKELQETCGIDVLIISCQVEYIPDSVNICLSESVKRAIPRACNILTEEIYKFQKIYTWNNLKSKISLQ